MVIGDLATATRTDQLINNKTLWKRNPQICHPKRSRGIGSAFHEVLLLMEGAPQIPRLLPMNKPWGPWIRPLLVPLKPKNGLNGAPAYVAGGEFENVHCSLNLPQASRLLGMTNLGIALP
jgi:hypothetical protein